jgi:alcohol dehydrogenase
MKAAYYTEFKSPISVTQLPDPVPGPDDAVIRVHATGICRSDWHGWQGHDSDIRLPHVPGHEFAGTIEEVGKNITQWKNGDRVTLPFSCGCGICMQCKASQEQICDEYFQPGFTAWGSFAEFVNIRYAAHNLVSLPDAIEFDTAAVLGCRFITAWRGIIARGRLKPGEWVAIHGCGGVGLSVIMIAAAFGAKPIAVDIDENKLARAKSLGAIAGINASTSMNVPEEINVLTEGGAHLSVDALGSRVTCRNSILCLRKQGRHIQLGLLAGKESDPPLPMSAVIARELEILGSHGMQAHAYPPMLSMILNKTLMPEKMIGKRVTLEQGVNALIQMDAFAGDGITIINL